MEEKKQVPQIRFKGYVDTWEQRKLGDIAVISSGIMGDSLLSDGDYRLTRIETIADGIVDESKIGYTNHKPDDNYLLQEGDILYSNINSISHMGKVAIYQGKSRLYHGINLLRLTSDNEVMSPYFLFYQLSTKPKRDWAKTHANQAVSQASINQTLLSEQGMSVCNIAEQKKISMFFSKLDNLITLHQRKYDKLVNIKKSMLEKMFPKNGRDVPEIRFKGFTDAWEQRKAVDIADYSKGNGYSKSDLKEAGTPIILYGRLYTKYQFAIDEIDTFVTPKDGSAYSQGNEVIIPASGETAEDIARASAIEKSGILLGGDLNILHPFNFINPLFLAIAISNGEPQKELAKKAQGKSVVHIHNSDIQEVSISFPTRAEQDRIVTMFRNLDNLITLHQRKLEKLKNIKKSMLDKMFV